MDLEISKKVLIGLAIELLWVRVCACYAARSLGRLCYSN